MRRLAFLPLVFLPLTAMAQQDDRDYLTALLEDNLSGAGRQITITGFTGALSSKATIEELKIADDEGVWLTLKDVVLDWNRAALLTGVVSVNELTAAEIILDRKPLAEPGLPSPEAKGFALPELPVSVNIERLAAERIELGAPVLGTAFEGSLEAALSLDGGDGTAKLAIQRTDNGPAGNVSLDASYTKETGQLSIDLDAREAAGGIATTLLGLPGAPAVELTVKGAGPITDFAADVRLASDGSERLAGTVGLQSTEDGSQGFNADLRGDLAPLFLPDYAEFFGPDVQLQTTGKRAPSGRLTLDNLAVKTRALTLDGALVVAADGLPEKINLIGQTGAGWQARVAAADDGSAHIGNIGRSEPRF